MQNFFLRENLYLSTKASLQSKKGLKIFLPQVCVFAYANQVINIFLTKIKTMF